MRFLTIIGAIVVLLVLASSGVLHGDLCAGQIGCVGSSGHGLTLHAAGTKP